MAEQAGGKADQRGADGEQQDGAEGRGENDGAEGDQPGKRAASR
jgi:hypothetical protein